jgi:3-methyladenine DNA glycosylase/8-oxoguanine DNA glycosylase
MAAAAERLLSARELETRARDWQPWRGYAVIHLWHAATERAARAGDGPVLPARSRTRRPLSK